MYNYAKFSTRLYLYQYLEGLVDDSDDETEKINCITKRLMDFILDYLASIKELIIKDIEFGWIIRHHRFKFCFQDLCELECDLSYNNNSQLFDKLADTCKNIKVLQLNGQHFSDKHNIKKICA